MQNLKAIWWPRKTKGVSSKEGKREREVCKFIIIVRPRHSRFKFFILSVSVFLLKLLKKKNQEKKASYKSKRILEYRIL